MPKYVASRRLKEPLAWKATLLEGDIAKEIAKLKEQPGRELRLVVYPFVFGRGQRVFENFDLTSLRLLDTKTFSTGAIALHYQPRQG